MSLARVVATSRPPVDPQRLRLRSRSYSPKSDLSNSRHYCARHQRDPADGDENEWIQMNVLNAKVNRNADSVVQSVSPEVTIPLLVDQKQKQRQNYGKPHFGSSRL